MPIILHGPWRDDGESQPVHPRCSYGNEIHVDVFLQGCWAEMFFSRFFSPSLG